MDAILARREQIINSLPATVSELVKTIGVSRRTIQGDLRTLIDANDIEAVEKNDGEGRVVNYYTKEGVMEMEALGIEAGAANGRDASPGGKAKPKSRSKSKGSAKLNIPPVKFDAAKLGTPSIVRKKLGGLKKDMIKVTLLVPSNNTTWERFKRLDGQVVTGSLEPVQSEFATD